MASSKRKVAVHDYVDVKLAEGRRFWSSMKLLEKELFCLENNLYPYPNSVPDGYLEHRERCLTISFGLLKDMGRGADEFEFPVLQLASYSRASAEYLCLIAMELDHFMYDFTVKYKSTHITNTNYYSPGVCQSCLPAFCSVEEKFLTDNFRLVRKVQMFVSYLRSLGG
jgi:hypothetical protein